MHFTKKLIYIPAAFLLTAVFAQAQAPQKTYISAADVAGLEAKAKNDRATTKKDAPNIINNLLSLAPYSANLEYRAAVGPAATHKTEAEMFYVVDGGGTLVTGGKLVNAKAQNADNDQGTAIEGGTTQKVAKGDFFIIPENTPHWYSQIDGVLVLMSLHVPRQAK